MRRILVFATVLAILAGCHESLEDRAAREAKDYTEKNCPTPVVNNTRMDSITFDRQTRTIAYYYTFCNNSDNAEAVKRNNWKLRGILLNAVKESTQLKAYKEAGFRIRYVYHSEKRPEQVLYETVFAPKDYSEKNGTKK